MIISCTLPGSNMANSPETFIDKVIRQTTRYISITPEEKNEK
jgi:hypothetical protein